MFAALVNRGLTDEILSTTICLVEQTLKALPKIELSDGLQETKDLTPNHFLIGRANEADSIITQTKFIANCYADTIRKT